MIFSFKWRCDGERTKDSLATCIIDLMMLFRWFFHCSLLSLKYSFSAQIIVVCVRARPLATFVLDLFVWRGCCCCCHFSSVAMILFIAFFIHLKNQKTHCTTREWKKAAHSFIRQQHLNGINKSNRNDMEKKTKKKKKRRRDHGTCHIHSNWWTKTNQAKFDSIFFPRHFSTYSSHLCRLVFFVAISNAKQMMIKKNNV